VSRVLAAAKPVAIDLFAGAGGASLGLRRAGYRVRLAVEIDKVTAKSYQLNHGGSHLLVEDIRALDPYRVMLDLKIAKGSVDLLQACPPCQTWSSLGRRDPNDERNQLITDVADWIRSLAPKAFVVENVPGLRDDRKFRTFLRTLRRSGYGCRAYIVDATEFGVPQRRRRLIVIGLRGADGRKLPRRLSDRLPKGFRTRAPSAAKQIARAEDMRDDPLQRPRSMSPELLARVAAIPVNGNRFDLPDDLVLSCHKKLRNRRATASYGRIPTTGPSATLTTRCTTPACGAYLHPTQDRGITLREAALLQTFPLNYRFSGPYGAIERQIGNAIPVRLAEGIARVMNSLLSPASPRGLPGSV
jgi:DNA (cytosine-5)-methyltransferase 1